MLRGVSVTAACVLAAGCGGDGEKAKTRTAAAQPSGGVLPRAILPRCGTDGFSRPRVRPTKAPANSRGAWSVSYTVGPQTTGGKLPAGNTTSLLIVEHAPGVASQKLERGRDVRIAGRLVSFREPDRKFPTYAAQWKTKRARYILIATGDQPTTIRRVIACLP